MGLGQIVEGVGLIEGNLENRKVVGLSESGFEKPGGGLMGLLIKLGSKVKGLEWAWCVEWPIRLNGLMDGVIELSAGII